MIVYEGRMKAGNMLRVEEGFVSVSAEENGEEIVIRIREKGIRKAALRSKTERRFPYVCL